MPQDKAAAPKVKKVTPYPFSVNLQILGKPIVFQILKVTPKGFIADAAKNVVKVGDEATFSFDLPVMKDTISGTVKVMRTYDQAKAVDDKSFGITRMVEFHFLNFTAGSREIISRFMAAIGQA